MLDRNEWAALRAKDQGAGLGGRWGRFSERVACRDWFVQGPAGTKARRQERLGILRPQKGGYKERDEAEGMREKGSRTGLQGQEALGGQPRAGVGELRSH